MDLKLPSFHRMSLRRTRRDPGMSIARAYWHWYLALTVGVCAGVLAAGAAYYEFMDVDHDDIVLTDPVATTRYRTEEIGKALERYDARKSSHVNISTVPPSTIEIPAVVPPVATPAPVRVE